MVLGGQLAALAVVAASLVGGAAADASIYAVVYSGAEGPNAGCSGGSKGQYSTVEKVPVVSGCTARHGARQGRAYYRLELAQEGATVPDTITYGCTNSSCTDCQVVKAPLNSCSALGDDAAAATESVSFQATANFLPQNTSLAPAAGVSMMWYAACGDPSALSQIDALGKLPAGSGDTCTEIRPGYYHSLHHTVNQSGKISGNWWCTDASCTKGSCVLSIDAMVIGQSLYNGQGCFKSFESARLNTGLGAQPACACTADHVYANLYTSDNRNERACGMGQPFETAIISKLSEGFSRLVHTPVALDINRVLKLGWDADRSRTTVAEYGADCETETSCKENITDPTWLKCYTTTLSGGSTALYPPDDICYGSKELSLWPGGLAVYSYYGSSTCPDDLAEADPSGVVEIRGYPAADGKCAWDGTTNNNLRRSYVISRNPATSTYNASFVCTGGPTANCSSCMTTVTNVAEGQCVTTAFGSMKIASNTMLTRCHQPAPPPPPSPAGPGTSSPETRKRESFSNNSPALIIASCGGVLVLAVGVAGFVYYMRMQSRNKYEGIVSKRSRSRSRSVPRRGREGRGRPQDRNRDRQGIYRDVTYYDGI